MRFAERREEDREENGGQISYRDSKNGMCPQRNVTEKVKIEHFKLAEYKSGGGKQRAIPVFSPLPYWHRADRDPR